MNRRARDRGITLTELLITISIAGIIITVLSSAIVMFLRNQDSAPDRIDRTRGLQQLVNYLPADLASSQTIEFEAFTAPCPGTGEIILNLSWLESFPNTTTDEVTITYRLSEDGTMLFRNSCGTEGSTSVSVAQHLVDASADPNPASPGQIDVTVDFGERVHIISGRSRNR